MCGWPIRAFVAERAIIKTSDTGYCPRCNAKARHRRIWRYLEDNTDIMAANLRLLDIAPWSSFVRVFRDLPNIEYVGVDLLPAGPQISVRGDLVSLPCKSACFDRVLCVHVLEHVEDDRRAIEELYRVLKPGGVAIVSVPIRLDRPTFEDPSITDPERRKYHFGERSHLRFYGADFPERLGMAGFHVSCHLAGQVSDEDVKRYGLRRDEHIFSCVKPGMDTDNAGDTG